MSVWMRAVFTALLCFVGIDAHAQSVLLVSATSYITDVQSKLQGTGEFTSVDVYDAGAGTPLIGDLTPYDAIFVISDGGFADSVALGDVVADYTDLGGGVVTGVFSQHSLGSPLRMEGRFDTGGYSAYVGSGQGNAANQGLVATIPGHSLLNNVASFNGGTAGYRNTVVLEAGATLVATWDDGEPLVAFNTTNGSSVVGLNFYPPSTDIRADFWDASTDGVALMSNALNWTLGPDVLIVHNSGYIADVQAKLQGTGRYGAVELFDAGSSTPVLGDLTPYDAVFLVSDGGWSSPTLLGDVVADYADQGGGVVTGVFSHHGPGSGLRLQGRFDTGGYHALEGTGQSGTNDAGLFPIMPTHPILKDVNSFSGGTCCRNDVSLGAEATLIAEWDDGMPLVAVSQTNGSRVAALNFYPPSSDIRGDFWDATTDGDLLMANAIDWAIAARDVLILSSSGYASDIQSKLAGSGHFSTVDLFDAGSGTPTVAEMMRYDVLFVVSDGGFSDPVAIGDNVADYLDAGGGMVGGTFIFHSPGSGLRLQGRVDVDGYLPYEGSGQGSSASQGFNATIPLHEIIGGVYSFNSGTSGYRNDVTLAANAIQVATYTDGNEFVATKVFNGARVAGLNFYPPSTDIRGDFWDATTDGDRLLVNAVEWAALGGGACLDSDGDSVCDAADACPGADDFIDNDMDGTPDGCDACPLDAPPDDDDGDFICDSDDACPLDPDNDIDGDGVCGDVDPCPLDNPDDADNDGICDGVDLCVGDDTIDTDNDGVPDDCDMCPADNPDDTDGDGVCDSDDVCPGFNDSFDADGDGAPDACDVCPLDFFDDSDNDGVCDSSDICAGGDDAVDGDGDGNPDHCDLCPADNPDDTDGDGVCDSSDICPGGNDAADDDNDGVPNACDVCPDDPADDSDGDGVCDSDDLCAGFDDGVDTDGDTVPDACDSCPDDPADDSDGDSICDSDDVCDGFDDLVDTDSDGVPDGCDSCPDDAADDSDGDGICDSDDICDGGDDAVDGDADGTPDHCDPCPLDNPDDSDGNGVCDSDEGTNPTDDTDTDTTDTTDDKDTTGCGCSSNPANNGLWWMPMIALGLTLVRRRVS